MLLHGITSVSKKNPHSQNRNEDSYSFRACITQALNLGFQFNICNTRVYRDLALPPQCIPLGPGEAR